MTLPHTFIGVDVAKDWIDVFDPSTSRHERIPTDSRSLRRFAAAVGQSIVVLEASGGYERPIMTALSEAERHTACVNPRQAREFARATGRLAKSDRVDAKVLAEMGRALQLVPAPPHSTERQRLSDLTAHRNDITGMMVAEKNRLRTTQDQWIRRSILQHIRALQGSQAKAEAEMEAVIQEQDELRDQAARLRCVKGIEPVVSATIIAQLTELGRLDRRRIAALAGLAPHANDSGHRRGKRSIWGGRGTLRRCLYLAALTASRFDPRFRAFKERLIAAGKARKLVIVACAQAVDSSQCHDQGRNYLPRSPNLKHSCYSGVGASGKPGAAHLHLHRIAKTGKGGLLRHRKDSSWGPRSLSHHAASGRFFRHSWTWAQCSRTQENRRKVRLRYLPLNANAKAAQTVALKTSDNEGLMYD